LNYGQSIARAERIRVQSDYDDFFLVSSSQARNQLDDARKFLKRIEEFIDGMTG